MNGVGAGWEGQLSHQGEEQGQGEEQVLTGAYMPPGLAPHTAAGRLG